MTKPPRPTDAELAILNVLWEREACTVREVLEHLEQSRPVGYTTVLKLLQIMHEKGLVTRDESRQAHVYRAAAPQEDTQRALVGDLLERGFAGSTGILLLRALEARPSSAEQLRQIRALLDRLESER